MHGCLWGSLRLQSHIQPTVTQTDPLLTKPIQTLFAKLRLWHLPTQVEAGGGQGQISSSGAPTALLGFWRCLTLTAHHGSRQAETRAYVLRLQARGLPSLPPQSASENLPHP